MSPWLIGITVACYGWTGMEFIAKGEVEWGTAYLCWATANICLVLLALKT